MDTDDVTERDRRLKEAWTPEEWRKFMRQLKAKHRQPKRSRKTLLNRNLQGR